MKRSLLFTTALFCVCVVNAQRKTNMQANPILVKKISGISSHLNGKPEAAGCDTLKLDSSNNWSPYYYTYINPDSAFRGYVLGVSNINDGSTSYLDTIKEDANYYDISGTNYNYITGGLARFAIANSNKAADLTKNLIFKVYDDDGTGEPGNLLGSTSLTLAQVKQDVQDSALTEFTFTTPIALPSNKIFYVSIDHSNFIWKYPTRDSIAIVADSSDQAPAAAIQYFDGASLTAWIPVNLNWQNVNTGEPLNVNLYLFPYVSTNADGSCAVLPVSVFGFKGSVINNQAVLSWNTAVELNNKGFEIQRSKDGKTFTDLNFVNGAGNSTQTKKYTYTDVTMKDLGVTTIYYRLKQVDADGKTSYSNVIPLSIKAGLTWKTYPNPVKDKLTLELNLTTDSKVNVQVISKDGKVMLNADKGTLTQGVQQMNLNIQNLSAGSYFVRVKAGNNYYTQTIIKQ